ncbi:MAG: hypothetical protein M0P61_00435 [Ignavibacteriaceae bacterium]|nr:hypothetical protein [Ignavibacteriaceae bacterium]
MDKEINHESKDQGLEDFLKFRADLFNQRLKSLGINAKISVNTDEEKMTFLNCLREITDEDPLKEQKTDLEKFVELYLSFGVQCIVKEGIDEKSKQEVKTIRFQNTNGLNEYGLDNLPEGLTTSEKFDGYGDSFTLITFSKDGEFLCQGFWG